MTAITNVSTAISAGASEADVKTFLLNQYSYLIGLFGTSGIPSDARSALGVSTLSSAAITTALGFSPVGASLASIASALGFTPGKNGTTFNWVYVGTFNPSGVNMYANYGPGIYNLGAVMFPIHAAQAIAQNYGAAYAIYKLSKD